MNPKLENTMSRIAEEARGRYSRLVRNARKRTESAADRVAEGKKPVQTMAGLGLKLTAISHRTADQVLKQQTRMVEHQIDAVAGRLKAAADSRNIGELVRAQIRLTPMNVARLGEDARNALSIVAGASLEVRDVLKGTIAELRGRAPAVRKTSARKSSRKKSARKPVRKTSAKRTAKKGKARVRSAAVTAANTGNSRATA